MMKHSIALLVATASMALTGCELYFGEEENNGSWTYCGSDGYYECNDNDCYWRGPECPTGGGSGGMTTPPGGFECKDNSDCAAGCFCQNGLCEEAGFCTQDSDCGMGFTCDESRSSCVPETEPPAVSCGADNDCATGEYCNPDTLKCEATCTCATDAEAVTGGYDYCDETRGTCLPGADPRGDCAGTVAPTCNVARPACPQGSVAMLSDGCFTGFCQVISACANTPECTAYRYDADCRGDTSCASSYTGTNCKKPDNTACQAGDTNCTCATYTFASCNDSSMPRTVEYNGFTFNIDKLTLRN
jgi:hypothetical protein